MTPKEALFDMLPQFVSLAIRTLDFVSKILGMKQYVQNKTAMSLAQEGLVLQSALSQWHVASILEVSHELQGKNYNAEALLARLYYHTISIYLDGIFSYHTVFIMTSAPLSPVLKRETIADHVASILLLSHELLLHGAAGILLFFPLRVAGARAWDSCTQAEILRLLRTVVQRGFAVALSFVEDLSGLWAEWR